MSEAAARPPRGSKTLFGVAFVLLLAAGAVLVVAARAFLAETGLLVASIVLSACAVVAAIVSLVAPGRS